MPTPVSFRDSALFRYIWNDDASGLAHRGLDEVTPEGVERIVDYATTHDVDRAPSTPGAPAHARLSSHLR